jgi:hypothetical protein
MASNRNTAVILSSSLPVRNPRARPSGVMWLTWNLVDMEIGKTYAFRVAANGGSGGISDWSVEVVRTAA